MTLKAIVDSLDDIPDGIKESYTERNGKYELQVEGMKTQADLDRISTALAKERNDHRVLRERFAPLGDRKVEEIIEQTADERTNACPFTHVFLQGGVGGLAAGIVSYFWEVYGANRPVFVIVEPEQANCLYMSAVHGLASRATGSVDSVMAGLACGEASPLAWRFLETGVDFFQTVSDAAAIQAMKTLARGSDADIPVVAGESGVAGLAALQNLAAAPQEAQKMGLNGQSRVLMINTEGATAPTVYRELVGESAESVLERQRAWQT